MCVNVPDDVRLGDESKDRTVNRELHVDKGDCRRKSQVRSRYRPAVELSDYSHPCLDFVFSILFDDFGTKSLPEHLLVCLDIQRQNFLKGLTWVSVRLRLKAKFNLSHTDKYRVVLNLFSNDTSCSYVKAVRALLLKIFKL